MAEATRVFRHSRCPWAIVLVLITFFSAGHAKNNVTFFWPTKHAQFHYTDHINVSFSSEYTHPFVINWCSFINPDPSKNDTIRGMSEQRATPGRTWLIFPANVVSPGLKTCWFQCRNETQWTPDPSAKNGKKDVPELVGDNSGGYFVINETREATIVGLPATLIPTSIPTSTTVESQAEATESSAAQGAASDRTGDGGSSPQLHKAALAGISVALGVVSIGFAVLAFLCWRRRRKGSGHGMTLASGGRHGRHEEKDAASFSTASSEGLARKPQSSGNSAPSIVSDMSTGHIVAVSAGGAGWTSPVSSHRSDASQAVPSPVISAPTRAHRASTLVVSEGELAAVSSAAVIVPPPPIQRAPSIQQTPDMYRPAVLHTSSPPQMAPLAWPPPPLPRAELSDQRNQRQWTGQEAEVGVNRALACFPGSSMQAPFRYVNGQDDTQKTLMVDRFTGLPARAAQQRNTGHSPTSEYSQG